MLKSITAPRRHILFAICFCSLSLTAFSCAGSQEKETSFLRGYVKIYGSEPHIFTGIVEEGTEKVYAVYPPEKEKELQHLQGHVVEFQVRFLEEPQGYGSLFLTDGTVTPVSWKVMDSSSGHAYPAEHRAF